MISYGLLFAGKVRGGLETIVRKLLDDLMQRIVVSQFLAGFGAEKFDASDRRVGSVRYYMPIAIAPQAAASPQSSEACSSPNTHGTQPG